MNLTKYNKKIIDLTKEGKYKEAIDLSTDAIGKFSGQNLIPFFYYRGNAYIGLEEYQKAFDDAEEAIKLFPSKNINLKQKNFLKEIHRMKTYCYNQLNRDSLSSLTKYHNKIVALNNEGKYKEAIDLSTEVIGKFSDQNLIPFFYYRGYAYIGLKEYEKAISDLDKGIELYGKPYEGVQNEQLIKEIYFRKEFCESKIGNAYIGLKEHQKAPDDAEEAIKLFPSENIGQKKYEFLEKIDSMKDYSSSMFEKFDEARETLTEYNDKIRALNNEGKYKEAIDLSTEVIDSFSGQNLIPFFYYRGHAYIGLKEYQKAFDDAEEAIKLFPSENINQEKKEFLERIYSMKAYCLSMFEKFDEARETLDEGFEKTFERLKSTINRYNKKDIEDIERLLKDLRYIYTKKTKEVQEPELKQKEKYNKELQDMIRMYTHALGNTIFPKNIYDVTKKLKSGSFDKKDILILDKAYQAEKSIKAQGHLLEAKMSRNSGYFQELIRKDRLGKGSKEEYIDIKEIIKNSIEIVLSRFLNESYKKIQTVRKLTLETLNIIDLNQLKEEYEKNVFFNEDADIYSWLKSSFLDVDLTIESKLWSSVRIRRNNYSHALLESFFMEALFNAIKYRDKNSKKWLDIELNEKIIENKNYLTVLFKNTTNKKSSESISSGEGINSMENDIRMLNEKPDNCLIKKQNGDIFELELFLQKDLFVASQSLNKFKRGS